MAKVRFNVSTLFMFVSILYDVFKDMVPDKHKPHFS